MVVLRLFRTVALLSLITSLGGAGWVVAGGPLTMQASGPAHVPNETLANHGYENVSVDHVRVHETITYAGVEKRVDVSMYVTTTAKVTDDGGSTTMTTLTLPAWRTGGVATNPLAHLPLARLLEFASPHLPTGFESVERVGSRSVSIAGTERRVSTYRLTSSSGAAGYLTLSRLLVEDDLVIVMSVRSERTDDGGELIELLSRLET